MSTLALVVLVMSCSAEDESASLDAGAADESEMFDSMSPERDDAAFRVERSCADKEQSFLNNCAAWYGEEGSCTEMGGYIECSCGELEAGTTCANFI